jgi:type II secretory pathway component HofQ
MKTAFFPLALLAALALAAASFAEGSPDSAGVPYSDISVPGDDQMIESFEVDNADARAVFKQLSAFSGVDIVLGDRVTGTVTLHVTKKTWKEIFFIVCRILKLSPLKETDYIYVLPSEDYKMQVLQDAQMSQQGELRREIIKLSNAPAAEMATSIASLLSPRGKLTVVEHNNAIIVFDTKENVEQIKATLKQLDIETQQISISCKIIEVSSSDLANLGIHWGFFDTDMGVNAQHLTPTNIVAGALEKLSYGVLSPERLSLALEYLFQETKAEIVAQPQITTLDNKQASMFTGSQVPVKVKDFSGNTVIQLVPAGTELIVTPHVSGDNRINMSLNPKKKSYTIDATGNPIIAEQSAQTNVVVSDGETVVIAGLTSNESQNIEGGIPVLKDIPIIGNLFKTSNKTNSKKDLVIFVTPHILSKKTDAAAANTSPK